VKIYNNREAELMELAFMSGHPEKELTAVTL
jgi:hypothetical protein